MLFMVHNMDDLFKNGSDFINNKRIDDRSLPAELDRQFSPIPLCYCPGRVAGGGGDLIVVTTVTVSAFPA